ncbi:MAG: hypothetical protein HC802_01335 [Caldilineaceae bacterium]|nr:hypothetical protein [Caldilineaceae bacterium]
MDGKVLTSDVLASNRIKRRSLVAMLGFHLIVLALLLLAAYVRTLPPTPTAIPEPSSAEAGWWGLWPVTYLPQWAFALGAVLIVALVATGWFRAFNSGPAQPDAVLPAETEPWQRRLLVLISALLLVAFFLFPIAHTRWGDAFLISRSLAWPEPELRLVFSWQAPLDVLLHSQLWALLRVPLGLEWKDATPVYRLLSPLAGALYLATVLALSRCERLAPAWLTYGLLVTLGLSQLFFGYVENYSFAAAGVLVYLWLGLGLIAGRRPLWLAALVLAFTNATHPSTVVLTPSLLFLAWIVWQRGNHSFGRVVLEVIAPMLLVGMGAVLLMEVGGHGIRLLLTDDRPGGSDARWFVPLLETRTRWEQYTMFSWPHLRDFLNEQLLVAPVVLPSLLWCALLLVRRDKGARDTANDTATDTASRQERSIVGFLFVATACYWLFIWVWNPDYGGQRDWDLFSLAALPSTLLLVVLLPKVLPSRRALNGAALPLIATQALFTLAWIFQNTLPWEWPD